MHEWPPSRIEDLLAGHLVGHLNRLDLPNSDLLAEVCKFVDDKVRTNKRTHFPPWLLKSTYCTTIAFPP